MEATTGVTAIILAAGFSRRLGRPKQLLPLDGKPLLQYALDAALATDCDEVLLVLGEAAPVILEQVSLGRSRVVINANAAEGQSTSIVAGVCAADPRRSGTLLMLGDQPGVTSDDLSRVLATFDGGRESIAMALWENVPRSPVVLGRAYDEALESLTGDEGARPLIMSHRDHVRFARFDRPVPPDIDTEEDYRLLLESWSANHSWTQKRRDLSAPPTRRCLQ